MIREENMQAPKFSINFIKIFYNLSAEYSIKILIL